MTPEWILAVCAVLTIAGALVTVLWKFTVSIDRMSVSIEKIEKIIEKFDDNFDDHSVRITKLEAWKEELTK